MSDKKASSAAQGLSERGLADDKMQTRLDKMFELTGRKEDYKRATEFALDRKRREEENRKRMQEFKKGGFLNAFSSPELDTSSINLSNAPLGNMPEKPYKPTPQEIAMMNQYD